MLKPEDPAQYKRFLEAAKKAEADETEEGADGAFRKIVRASQVEHCQKLEQSGGSMRLTSEGQEVARRAGCDEPASKLQ